MTPPNTWCIRIHKSSYMSGYSKWATKQSLNESVASECNVKMLIVSGKMQKELGFHSLLWHLLPHNTSRSSPPFWMTWPIDAWFWARMKHCLLHSSSCSRSCHSFICSMLSPWFSRTNFCFSRSFCSPERRDRVSENKENCINNMGK